MTQAAFADLERAIIGGAALLLMVAGWRDIATRTVPNQVSAVIAGIGIVLQILAGDLLLALASAFAVFLLAFFCGAAAGSAAVTSSS